MVQGSNPAAATSLRNFGNSVYPALPVSFGGDTKSRRSLLYGVYARGSKRSHQSALEMCNLSWTPPLLKSVIMQRKRCPALNMEAEEEEEVTGGRPTDIKDWTGMTYKDLVKSA